MDTAPGAQRVLVLNAGSSSLKASLIEPPDGTVARMDLAWGADAARQAGREAAAERIIAELLPPTQGSVGAVGHRIVHGGSRFVGPTRLDDGTVKELTAMVELAPLHNGVALEVVAAARRTLPDVPHVASFDTAFHATLEEDAWRYPLPHDWAARYSLRRFGFHGLSVAWSVRRAEAILGRAETDLAIVVAHLGSGCSVTAVHHGHSVDTSMGFTPLEGLMMGTRSGSVDPGILLHLLRSGAMDVAALGEALEHRSGLLGVSGRSADVRDLEWRAGEGDAAAGMALAIFTRRAAAAIAAAASALPRLDALIFTGGIGLHATALRAGIVARLAVLGIEALPTSEPPPGDGRLDRGGNVAVLAVEAREDLIIAAEAARTAGLA